MVDRVARDRLIEVVRLYLNAQISAFEFDDRIFEIADRTEDRTVDEVVCRLWLHYDDISNHEVYCTHEEWNYFQRLLLLLSSDEELDPSVLELQWDGVCQGVALSPFGAGIFLFRCFAIMGIFAIPLIDGFGANLWICMGVFALVDLLLRGARWLSCRWKSGAREDVSPSDPMDPADRAKLVQLYPFASLSHIRRVRQSVPEFRKQTIPKSMKQVRPFR